MKPQFNFVLLSAMLFCLFSCDNRDQSASATAAQNGTAQTNTILYTDTSVTAQVQDPREKFGLKPKLISVNPTVDTAIVIDKKGTTIHIPENAFLDANGNVVKDPVQLQFTNYTNSADIVFSNIPMTYKENGVEKMFNSAGMFNIEGNCNGQEITIAPGKELSVDYALTQKPKDLGFYVLDESTNEWSKLKDIEPVKATTNEDKKSASKKDTKPEVVAEFTNETKPILVSNLYWLGTAMCNLYWSDENGKKCSLAEVTCRDYKFPAKMAEYLLKNRNHYLSIQFELDIANKKLMNIKPHPLNPTKDFNEDLVLFLNNLPEFELDAKNSERHIRIEANNGVLNYTLQITLNPLVKGNLETVNRGFRVDVTENQILAMRTESVVVNRERSAEDVTGTWISPSYSDAGHTYPDLVKGLTVEKFGVYNCDQTYSFNKPTWVKAKYITAEGQPIDPLKVLSLIDYKYRGAYSWDPYNFKFDAASSNALVLFSNSGKVYLFDKHEFKKLYVNSGNEEMTLTVVDITDKVKNSSDLAKLLEIKS
jgi:hypothetical protein